MKDYARRIYAFAYAKTGNTRDAEDLSQDILLELYRSDFSAARDPDAWVSGICRHVWARYLNRNKRHWEAVGAAPLMEFMAAEDDISLSADSRAEYEELRQEIAYLSRMRREVLVMYYFDGHSVDDIAEKLMLAPATVRWHMMKARSDLKERLDMENRSGMREKVRLNVGHSGSAMDGRMYGLQNDLLTQNIAWVCHGRKLTVEEIARKLGVPAVYLESILARLTEMDYMKLSGGRYTTNFFIMDKAHIAAVMRYRHRVYAGIAKACLRGWQRSAQDIRNIGFIGSDLPETELMWHFIPMIAEHACYRAYERLRSEANINVIWPKRADGSEHFVHASVACDTLDDELLDRLRTEAAIYGIKSRSMGDVESIQYDIGLLTKWRDFNGSDILKLSHAARAGDEPDEYLKEEAAALIRDGYVEMVDGRLQVMIPYMTKAQWDAACNTINAALTNEEQELVYKAYAGFKKLMDELLPGFVDKNERSWLSLGCDDIGMTMWHLATGGLIEVPAPDIARRLATVVRENK